MSEKIKIEVAYALPEQQKIVALEVDPGTTARQAALASGIDRFFPGLDVAAADLGVFGKSVKADKYEMQEGDRIEIYRPLIADPKESRKARAAKAKDK